LRSSGICRNVLERTWPRDGLVLARDHRLPELLTIRLLEGLGDDLEPALLVGLRKSVTLLTPPAIWLRSLIAW
jgi:hypothetical protein